MLLDILDMLTCPICKNEQSIWKMEGNVTNTRIVDGKITCPSSHTWQVREEVLRLDREISDEDMLLLDHEKTGFPPVDKVGELERGDFLEKFNNYVASFPFASNKLLKITGSPILFFNYIKENPQKILVIHPDEGILRQIQVMAAKKQIYNNMSFVRAKDVELLGANRCLHLFEDVSSLQKLSKNEIALAFGKQEDGNPIWNGERMSLVEVTDSQ
jgi:uncharacterized protein YbaR (Trm112 family)